MEEQYKDAGFLKHLFCSSPAIHLLLRLCYDTYNFKSNKLFAGWCAP